jgi:hypothetical protein
MSPAFTRVSEVVRAILSSESALKNRLKRFVIDGEAAVLGVDGISDFNAQLVSNGGRAPPELHWSAQLTDDHFWLDLMRKPNRRRVNL